MPGPLDGIISAFLPRRFSHLHSPFHVVCYKMVRRVINPTVGNLKASEDPMWTLSPVGAALFLSVVVVLVALLA